MTDLEFLIMMAINLFFMSIVIWRVEAIRDEIVGTKNYFDESEK